MKRVWLIEGRDEDGADVFREEVPFAHYTERQMKELLRLLTARAEMTFEEIFQSTGRVGADRTSPLDVRRSLQSVALRCGSAWSFSARMMLKDRDGALHAPRPAHL